MILFILLYLVPAICNFFLFRDCFKELSEDTDEYERRMNRTAYGVVCLFPTINLIALIYVLICMIDSWID